MSRTLDFHSSIEPDWKRLQAAARNHRVSITPLYEHMISGAVMDALSQTPFSSLQEGDERDQEEFFRRYLEFQMRAGYDAVIFEIPLRLPGGGAILPGHPGVIRDRNDLERYPWEEALAEYRQTADRQFGLWRKILRPDRKIIGGVGCTGVFEMSEDLVGLGELPFLEADDPETFSALYRKLGDLAYRAWEYTLERYGDLLCVARLGDDLGFHSSLLTTPRVIRELVLPQHRRIIELAHRNGLPLLFHSCGCIFEMMEEIIAGGIDAKHSNEESIAPYERWIDLYADKIGLFGGFDLNLMVMGTPDEIRNTVLEKAPVYRKRCRGYALGTGHSIPEYVPPENYLALLEAAETIRRREQNSAFRAD